MRIAVITLRSRSSFAIGGEDQVGPFLCRSLERLGHEAFLFAEHESALMERMDFDLVISNGAQTFVGHHRCPAMFWHFNERLDLKDALRLKELGFTHLATNQTIFSEEQKRGLMQFDGDCFYLPLAADRQMLSPPRFQSNPYSVRFAYLGNWNDYKGSKIEEWLEPIRDNLYIFGGTRWHDHPTLKHCYQGIYPKDKWSDLCNIAPVWIAFRSPTQAQWGMVGDRIYWLMAAGVDYIVADLPESREFRDDKGELFTWNNPDCLQVLRGYYPRCAQRFQDFIRNGNLYDYRMSKVLEKVL